MKWIAIAVGLLITLQTWAQKGSAEEKAAIHKLHWMVGNWMGASVVNFNGEKRITHIKETVQPLLDGTLLQITVRATDADSVTHKQSLAYTSFSVISYDAENKKYRWTSWRTNGRNYEEQPFTADENSFEYGTKEDGKTVRYKARLGSNGEFLEEGEYAKNNASWEEFITMKLSKIKR